MISLMILMDAMRATPPSLRMSAGTRSSAITEHAPASSAILACSAFVTSMITPPFSISARPIFNFICWSYSHMTPPQQNAIHFETDGGAKAAEYFVRALLLFRAHPANRREWAPVTVYVSIADEARPSAPRILHYWPNSVNWQLAERLRRQRTAFLFLGSQRQG